MIGGAMLALSIFMGAYAWHIRHADRTASWLSAAGAVYVFHTAISIWRGT